MAHYIKVWIIATALLPHKCCKFIEVYRIHILTYPYSSQLKLFILYRVYSFTKL